MGMPKRETKSTGLSVLWEQHKRFLTAKIKMYPACSILKPVYISINAAKQYILRLVTFNDLRAKISTKNLFGKDERKVISTFLIARALP